MKYWLIVPWTPVEEMIQIAKHADDLGFYGLMGADHGFVPKSMVSKYPYTKDGAPPIDGSMPYPDVWTSIAAMSAVTSNIKFSTAVYVLPLRNPIEVAKATGTVANISGNRLILGAGVGWMPEEFATYGVDFKTRGKRMNECIDVLNLIWDGGYVEYHGEFFNFDPLQIAPAPSQRVPIIIGGASKPALWRAGRVAQGWMGNGNNPEEMPTIFKHLKDSRESYGRSDEEFDIILAMNDFPSAEQMYEYVEQGATGTFLGFPDHIVPVSQKLHMLDGMAKAFLQNVAG